MPPEGYHERERKLEKYAKIREQNKAFLRNFQQAMRERVQLSNLNDLLEENNIKTIYTT